MDQYEKDVKIQELSLELDVISRNRGELDVQLENLQNQSAQLFSRFLEVASQRDALINS